MIPKILSIFSIILCVLICLWIYNFTIANKLPNVFWIAPISLYSLVVIFGSYQIWKGAGHDN